MKYKEIANNKEINAYLQKGNANLGQLGFTDKGTLRAGCTSGRKDTETAGIFRT